MKKIYSLVAVLAATLTANAQSEIITQWNFDATDYTLAVNPTTGTGTFSIIGGVEVNLTSGAMPQGVGSEGKAYSIKTFPAQGENSGTAGYQFSLSTSGYENITLSFDPRSSNTGSKWMQYEMSTDGTTWTVLGNNNGALANDFNNPVSLTLPATANNQGTITFKLVSIFAPETQAYAPVGTSYAVGGAWRIDNLTISGEEIDDTASIVENNIEGLKVYPNPASDLVNIVSNEMGTKTIAIYDMLGKKVLETSTEETVNVSTLTSGVYIMNITQDGKKASRKLVIK